MRKSYRIGCKSFIKRGDRWKRRLLNLVLLFKDLQEGLSLGWNTGKCKKSKLNWINKNLAMSLMNYNHRLIIASIK